MKIVIVSPGALTIPAINGGAVETLINLYIDYNESLFHNNIIVFSNYEKNNSEYKKYKYTKFEYINKKNYIFRIKRIVYGVINKIFKQKIGNAYINRVKNICRKKYKDIDKIIIENMPEYVLPIKKVYSKEKILLHQHNDFLNPNTLNAKDIVNSLYKIITVSEFVKNKIMEIDKNINIEVVYNGVDFNKFSFQKEKNKDIVIGYIGRIVPEKGVKELIEAVKKLNSKNIKVCYSLNIIGGNKTGIESDYLLECKNISKNENNIHFLGYKDNSLLNNEYAKIDISVVPSIIDDACPLTVIESVVSGSAILCTNSGGIPELVNDNAIIVERDDLVNNLVEKLEYLLINPKIIEKMKEKSIEYATRYDSDKFCKQLNEKIFQER